MTFQLDPLVIVAILGLVNFVKEFGLTGKVLTLASMALGLVISVLVQVLPAQLVQVALIGILSGLGASGFYDLGSMIGAKRV